MVVSPPLQTIRTSTESGADTSDDDLVDQAAEQGLLLRPSEVILVPEFREVAPDLLEAASQLGRYRRGWALILIAR